MDRFSEPQEACPLANKECPLVHEIRRLKQECERLQELSQIDTLTGFFNFYYLLNVLEGEMERARRTGLSTSLLMIDMDHFKQINDSFGHECGNKALRWATKIWRENIRRIDIPCRYGGEEFAVILPGIHLSHAVRTAERLRLLLANSHINLNGELVKLTASFGVDVYRGENLSVKAFIERTDHFLLKAKKAGRNCVCHKEISIPSTEITEEERKALLI